MELLQGVLRSPSAGDIMLRQYNQFEFYAGQ
jgi:hypothetical protein